MKAQELLVNFENPISYDIFILLYAFPLVQLYEDITYIRFEKQIMVIIVLTLTIKRYINCGGRKILSTEILLTYFSILKYVLISHIVFPSRR